MMSATANEITRYELCFSGSGGQGLITAAIIFAEAAGKEGKFVCQTQSYGPEARGGKSKAEVVISNAPIDYPKALSLDILLAMTQEACDAYFYKIKQHGLLVVDSDLVTQCPTSRVIARPFTRIAREKTGKDVAANMVSLGVLAKLSGQISLDSLKQALLSRVPAGTGEMNQTALQAGIEQADLIDCTLLPRGVTDEEDEL